MYQVLLRTTATLCKYGGVIRRLPKTNGTFHSPWNLGLSASSSSKNYLFSTFPVDRKEAPNRNRKRFKHSDHVELENDFAHRIIEEMPAYQNRIMNIKPKGNSSNLELQDVITMCENIVISSSPNYTDIARVIDSILTLRDRRTVMSEKIFLSFCQKLAVSIQGMNEEDFLEVLEWISHFELRQVSKVKMTLQIRNVLGNALGKPCDAFVDQWDRETIFKVLDVYYHLKYRAIPKSLFYKLQQDVESFTKEDVVQSLFYISLARFANPQFRQKLEKKILEFLNDLTVDELSIACLGLHKAHHNFKSTELVEFMAKVLADKIDVVKELTLAGLLKTIFAATNNSVGYMSHSLKEDLSKIFIGLLPRIGRFDISTSIHVCRVSFSLRMLNRNIFNSLCDRALTDDLTFWRIKDLSWFLLQCGTFQSKLNEKETFYQKMVDDLETHFDSDNMEREKFPHCYVQALVGLSYVGVFSERMLQEVFSPDYVEKLKASPFDISRDLHQLDETVGIELPNYSGPRLPDNFLPKDHYSTRDTHLPQEKRPNQQSSRDRILLEIQRHFQGIFNDKVCCDIDFLLPHIRTADVIFEVDQQRNIVPLKMFGGYGNKKFVLSLRAPNCYMAYHAESGFTRRLLGPHVLKERQLVTLGYHIIEIPYYEWPHHENKRGTYLKKRIMPYVNIPRK